MALPLADDSSDVTISRAVRALMAPDRIRQADVAAAIGMSAAAFSERLNRSTHWKASEVMALAKFFKRPVGQFYVDPDQWSGGLSTSGYMLTAIETEPGPMILPNMDNEGRPLPDPELAVA